MSSGGPITITRAEYERKRRHDAAGPLSTLLPENQERYRAIGATAWQLRWTAAGTALCPVVVTDDPQP